MNEDERFVRGHWEDVTVEWGRIEGKLYGMATSQSRPIYLHGYKTEAEIWSAARRFTEERLEKIRQVEEEIALMGARLITANIKEMPIRKRILAREQAALDSLRRGMKKPAARTATE